MKKLDMEDVVAIEETDLTIRGYRHRTTVPSKIFEFLKLKEGDALRWIATKDGSVYVLKVGEKEKSK
jgi:bifunctional DNA-binding transcriptional regulator/antitoxin component of YhaV-PrlF toxin-antitoxin module